MSDVAIIMGSDSDWPTMEEAAITPTTPTTDAISSASFCAFSLSATDNCGAGEIVMTQIPSFCTVCVGTPQSKDGLAADLTYVKSAVAAIAPHLKEGSLVVGKSTVPVGTAQGLREELSKIAPQADLAWNPEFLREG